MGHNILYTKNTKLCIKMTRHRVTQVLREVLERVIVKKPILIHEIVAMDLYGRKELVVFTEKVSMKMQNNNY
jgi:NAD dependent epimerase/dehydratase family enzyme